MSNLTASQIHTTQAQQDGIYKDIWRLHLGASTGARKDYLNSSLTKRMIFDKQTNPFSFL